jgi:signal recognition particle receptor subunit beta
VATIEDEYGTLDARVVYWGIAGSGISSNLAMIHGKLKENNRGALRSVPTGIDPSVTYEVLPIELGQVNGLRTRMHVVGAPGGREQAPTRKQLLDRINGVVFVADSRPECIEDNVASLRELVGFLADYGHTPSDLPFVIQYNKCDLVDPFVIERIHREIQIPGAAVYEASAKTGTGVLKTLTTITKQVIRQLSKRPEAHDATPPSEAAPQAVVPQQSEVAPLTSQVVDEANDHTVALSKAAPSATVVAAQPPPASLEMPPAFADANNSQTLMEAAILAEEAEALAGNPAQNTIPSEMTSTWDAAPDVIPGEAIKAQGGARIGADLRIVSVGDVRRKDDRAICVPLVLGNDDGETVTLALTIQLDPLLDGDT